MLNSSKGQPAAPNAPWPHPQHMNASSDLLFIDPNFFILYSNLQDCDIIDRAIERYKPLFFPPKLFLKSPNQYNSDQVLTSVLIRVSSELCPIYPQLRNDESCKRIQR